MLPSSRLRAVRALVPAGFLASIAISYPLWTGWGRTYPRAPVAGVLEGAAPWAGWWEVPLTAALCALLAAVALVRAASTASRCAAGALIVLAALAVGDQTRWQPWAYQYAIMLFALALPHHDADGERGAVNACRVTVALTYFWSGAQKLAGGGSGLLLPAATAISAALHVGPTRVLLALNALTGLAEIAIGAGLIGARWRRAALAGALATHAFIIVALASHRASANAVVWPWNVALAAISVALFRGTSASGWREVLAPRQGIAHATALFLIGVLPALSLVGRWDPYLSAALYSGNTGAAYVQWAPAGNGPPVPPRAIVDDPRRPWRRLTVLPAWALAELRVPGYPADRVYRQVARQLCRDQRPDEHLTLVLRRRLTLAEVVRSYTARFHQLPPPQPQRIYDCAMLLGDEG